jgi:predicted O-linked N-acetylglucosamine transferase (SPINDLY family)
MLERSTRLELALRAWKALVLPLHHDRDGAVISAFLITEKTRKAPFYRLYPATDIFVHKGFDYCHAIIAIVKAWNIGEFFTAII